MTRIVLTALTLLLSPAYLTGQAATLTPRPVADELLVDILNSATLQELNNLRGPSPHQLSLRLFAIAQTGSCIPHTHQICARHYFLAVSEFDELPEQAVFDLGTVGELRNIEWLRDERMNAARLQLDVVNYPASALRANPELQERVMKLELDVTVEAVRVNPTSKQM